ncbi:hypothetical protein KCP73_22945 [Salmonella enterica subsp. enterica]|nr:hypothetical protein KCP73_22945 [Salmonella enterica subsp. enterica]
MQARGCEILLLAFGDGRSQAEALLLEVSRHTCDLAQRGATLFWRRELGMANHASRRDEVSVSYRKYALRWGLARIFRLPASIIIKWTSCGGRLRLISPIRAMA